MKSQSHVFRGDFMRMKPMLLFCTIGMVALVQLSFTTDVDTTVDGTINYFKREAAIFSLDAAKLHEAIKAIDPCRNDKEDLPIKKAKLALIACRVQYKKIAFFLEYFFPSEAHIFNAAAVTEVEDAELEFIEPMGLQQIESLLYQRKTKDWKNELLIHSESLYSSAEDIRSLLYQFSATDAQVLESVRLEIIRILTLYITGYDAPELKSGIIETEAAIAAIDEVLENYILLNPAVGNKMLGQLKATKLFLAAHKNFDKFPRMEFLQQFGLPLQQTLGLFIKSLNLELNTSGYLNYDAANIFSKGALAHLKFTSDPGNNTDAVELGEMLFSEKALSINNTRSCATCHRPDSYFTDMLTKSNRLSGHGTVSRNAPTLLYSGLQHTQFWDGRVTNVPDLIQSVIRNTEEMNGDEGLIRHRLMQDTIYQFLFIKVFPQITKDSIGLNEIARAIAAYIQTLNPMTSAFDRYIQGDKQAMSETAVNGFDLFMGKAKCATCHFAPVFNSLLPPYYNVSEYEIIGAPLTDNLLDTKKDMDRGRFTTYPVKYYDGSFKTPTVRNVAKTAPYMHNGAFRSLDSVISFYNKGGGEGIGIPGYQQTLSAEPLNLSSAEVNELIQFLNALTDQPTTFNLNKHP